jgi:flagellar hook-length control protein FliK
MLAVNAAQPALDAASAVAGEPMPDGGFKGVLEQRMQSAGGDPGGAAADQGAAQAPVPEPVAATQLVDSNRIAADAMAAFLATQAAPVMRPDGSPALPMPDALLQAVTRGPLTDPTLAPTTSRRMEAPEIVPDAATEAVTATELRAAMDAVAGRRLPQAATDSPASFRALMADVVAARTEGGPTLQPGGPGAAEGSGLLPANAQASATPSPGEARTATTQVATPFGRPEWTSAMNERVTWLVGQRVQSADIQINPPQLGPVEVRITIKDDQASLFFTSQHAAVREAIQAALPRLNEMLAQGGLSLGQTSVGAESFAGQQQASRDGHGGRRQEPEVPAGLAGAISAAVPGDLTVLRGRVGVDMFV